jgi:D-3-phosphoglycerate dehydrogenase
MKKILIATEKPFSKDAVDQIQSVAKHAEYATELLENYTDKTELLEKVADANALIIRSDKVTKEVLEAGKNLEIVVRAGAGYDNVDCTAATENNVVVMNTPGQNSNAVAELAFGMMIMLIRNSYTGKAGTELMGKKLGIHAYGNIGKCVARIAKGFGMEILVFDPYKDKASIENDGVKTVNSIDELYSQCQYISIHIPANESTKKSINYDLISKMPKNGCIVNTARKEVIDEEGLIQAMKDKPLLSYISDIAPDLAEDFKQFDGRYFFTAKKMGAQTKEANLNAGVAAIKQIVDFFENGNTRFKVN